MSVLGVHLFIIFCSLWMLGVRADDPARILDGILQENAFKALVQPLTGVSYDGNAPSNLAGIKVSGMRLRSGSFERQGVEIKEFYIPDGVVVNPSVKRLVLVYQNLGNWSEVYYPIPGFTYMTPVLGLLAYDGDNLSSTDLLELDVRATVHPILINFAEEVRFFSGGYTLQCVNFDLQGRTLLSNVHRRNICSTKELGHFGIVAAPISPAPVSPTPVPPAPLSPSTNKHHRVLKVILTVIFGFIALGMLLAAIKRIERTTWEMDELSMQLAEMQGTQLQRLGMEQEDSRRDGCRGLH
ncbi:uncharacterized protein LOC122082053 [Macadamia integrifolia]|uniref:uncharacterized protein LOC122082053 n=1 Tax=Macadamia integrifolia TaxID=60698 RepID=UPI001C5007CB|nr:uncharacterized protein LOC122082053 [Macadamia integrifolia]